MLQFVRLSVCQVSKYVSKCFSTAPHIRSHRAPCSCVPKAVSLQLSSEHSVGDVGITQLDWKRVPQARSGGCKSSVGLGWDSQLMGWVASGHTKWTHVDRYLLPPHRALGRKAAGYRCCCQTMGQTDRQTDGQTHTRPVVLKWQPDFAGDERCSTVTSYVHMKAP